MRCIRIKQPSDHALILRVVLARLVLEKVNAALTQRDGDFYAFLTKYKILRLREEIRNDLQVPEGLVRVFDSLAHRFAFLCANNRLRGCESRSHGKIGRASCRERG